MPQKQAGFISSLGFMFGVTGTVKTGTVETAAIGGQVAVAPIIKGAAEARPVIAGRLETDPVISGSTEVNP